MNAIILAAILGVVMMFSSVFIPNKSTYKYIAIVGMIALLGVNWADTYGWRMFDIDTKGMLNFSRYGYFFNTVCIAATLVYLLLSGAAFEKVGNYTAEYFALVFFVLCGISIITSFNTLLMLFLGVEIMSIPLYILTGADKRNLKSNEASLKYFLMGSFTTGIMLMGIALIYAATGSFNLDVSRANNVMIGTTVNLSILEVTGCILLFISLAFKVSAAPFHFWTPDVYDGAPSVFTSFMATVIKAAGFLALYRFFDAKVGFTGVASSPNLGVDWKLMLAIVIVLTLLAGNVTAVFQQSVKRMLAYSSIAQAGFMMMALFGNNDMAKEGLVLYALVYSLATIGIFAVLVKMKDYTFEGFNGLAKENPVIAFATTIFLLSLAGIPLTGGFFAKYFMLASVVKTGSYLWLVVVAVLFAAISVYYYFRVIQAMYFKTATSESPVLAVTVPPLAQYAFIALAIAIIIVGVWPQAVLQYLYF